MNDTKEVQERKCKLCDEPLPEDWDDEICEGCRKEYDPIKLMCMGF